MKTQPLDILILTTRTGGGHMNLAQALKEMLEASYSITIADPYPAWLNLYYSLLSRHFLQFWNIQYHGFDNQPMSLALHQALTLLVQRPIERMIAQHQPRLIISTHPLLSYEIASTLRRARRRIPLVFQLTDLEEVHVTWFTEKHADAYLAPTKEICEQAVSQGIESSLVHTTGRPVRGQFREVTASRIEVLKGLGLEPDVFTVFLQGGARGSAGAERTVRNILDAEVPMQIILAAGNNPTLIKDFSGMERLKVVPFTPTIAPYMAASDIIVGKPGASFLTESFTLEKPFVVTTFIPGQEWPSLRFLERYNLGWMCLDERSQRQTMTAVAHDTSLLTEKVESIRAYKAWNQQANERLYPVIDALMR